MARLPDVMILFAPGRRIEYPSKINKDIISQYMNTTPPSVECFNYEMCGMARF
jgi:hypothetical protein